MINPRPFRIWLSVRPFTGRLYPRWQMCRCHVIALNVRRCSFTPPFFRVASAPGFSPVAYVALIKLVFIMALAKSPPIRHAPRLLWSITSSSMGITCKHCIAASGMSMGMMMMAIIIIFRQLHRRSTKSANRTKHRRGEGEAEKIEIGRRACNWQSTIDSV